MISMTERTERDLERQSASGTSCYMQPWLLAQVHLQGYLDEAKAAKTIADRRIALARVACIAIEQLNQTGK